MPQGDLGLLIPNPVLPHRAAENTAVLRSHPAEATVHSLPLSSTHFLFNRAVEIGPLVVWAIDERGIFRISRGKALELIHLQPDEVVGRSVYELYGDYPDVISNCQAALAGESRHVVLKVGEIHWENWLTPLRDEQGRVQGVLGVGADATERVLAVNALSQLNRELEARISDRTRELEAANLALRKSEEYWRSLVQCSPDVVMLTDTTGMITFCNHTLLRPDLTTDQVVGMNLVDFVFPEYVSVVQQTAEEVCRTSEYRSIEVYGPGPHGKTIWYGARVGPVRHADQVVALTVTVRDLTPQRVAQEAAIELQNRLAHLTRLTTAGEMSAALAHELNQPLTAIGNYVYGSLLRLESTHHEPATLHQDLIQSLIKIRTQSQRATEIIESLRRFLQRQPSRVDAVALGTVASESIRLAELEARRHRIQISLQSEPDLPPVEGDRVQLVQVVLNLLLNAMEAINPACGEGQIVVTICRRDEKWLELSVTDNGVGLPTGLSESIFEAWVTTKAKGMGLGLSMCRTLVELHHGKLTAESNTPGPGATFRMLLRPFLPAE